MSSLSSCLPFSEIDQFLAPMKGDIACLSDTSFLIALADEDHPHHDDAIFLQEKLADYKVKIFLGVTARSEFIDFHRRCILTENLMGMLAPSSKWQISASVCELLKKQQGWIDNQPKQDNAPYLSDSRLKICKQAFLPRNQSGQIGWLELCREYLCGRLASSWEKIVDIMQLQYIDMRAEDSKELFRKDLLWPEMYRLAEESGLGSQDAMILNLLDASIFSFIVTMDFDLAYGVLASTRDKVALVPDNLYRNRLKKLKF